MNLHKHEPFRGIELRISYLFKFEPKGEKLLEKFLDITGYLIAEEAVMTAVLVWLEITYKIAFRDWLAAYAIGAAPFIYVYWRYAVRYMVDPDSITCRNCRKLTLGEKVSRRVIVEDMPICIECEASELVRRENLRAIKGARQRAAELANAAYEAVHIILGDDLESIPHPIEETPPKEGDPDHAIGR